LAYKAFSPNPIRVKVGDTLIWTNDDFLFHTVTLGTGMSDKGEKILIPTRDSAGAYTPKYAN
jgi:plastocyanin